MRKYEGFGNFQKGKKMTKSVVSSPRNKRSWQRQTAMMLRLEKGKSKGEARFRQGGLRLRQVRQTRH